MLAEFHAGKPSPRRLLHTMRMLRAIRKTSSKPRASVELLVQMLDFIWLFTASFVIDLTQTTYLRGPSMAVTSLPTKLSTKSVGGWNAGTLHLGMHGEPDLQTRASPGLSPAGRVTAVGHNRAAHAPPPCRHPAWRAGPFAAGEPFCFRSYKPLAGRSGR